MGVCNNNNYFSNVICFDFACAWVFVYGYPTRTDIDCTRSQKN